MLGGLGSLAGALVGAALLTFLPQVVTDLGTDAGLSDIQAAELAPLVYGLVMVLVILLAPPGSSDHCASCARAADTAPRLHHPARRHLLARGRLHHLEGNNTMKRSTGYPAAGRDAGHDPGPRRLRRRRPRR